MAIIEYSTGEPTEDGVYACRVQWEPPLYKDVFLMHYKGRWTYVGSDQTFRDKVPYWIGPLRRRMPAGDTP